MSIFKDFKRTLLEWVAIYLTKNLLANIHTYITTPYNHYEPRIYERWMLNQMLDIDQELKTRG